MFKLSESKDFTWIDHHKSVIDEYDAYRQATGKAEIKGIRRSGTAAIELTWEYFYPKQKLPEGLELLGKHDVFDLRDPRVQPFEYAMQAHGQNMPDDAVWPELFAGRIDIDKMVDEGRRILDWINIRNYRLVRSMAFETEKEDSANHGFGHRIIRRIAKKYNGYANYTIENNQFIAEVMLDCSGRETIKQE